jgi:hypothetical protein
MVVELGLLIGDLGPEELVLGLTRVKGAVPIASAPASATARPPTSTVELATSAPARPVTTRERDQQAILAAEHELADPRQAADPLSLAKHTPPQRLARLGMRAASSPALWQPALRNRRSHPLNVWCQTARATRATPDRVQRKTAAGECTALRTWRTQPRTNAWRPSSPQGGHRRRPNMPLDCRGTCLGPRGLSEDQFVEGARRSTLEQLADASLWADKTLAS